MRVLVTGSSGFVGHHLVAALQAAGLRVRAAGRRPPASTGAEFVPLADLRRADWPALVSGMDAVIHLAAVAHARGIDETRLRETNYEPVVALCRALGAGQRLLYLSSIRAVTGPSAPMEITEDAEPRPDCAYGAWKLRAEQSVRSLRPQAAILRPVSIYGAGARHNLARLAFAARLPVPLPVARLSAPRSWCSVQNLCSAAIFLLRDASAGAFTVADPDVASLRDLVVWLRAARGARARVFSSPAVLSRLRFGSRAFEDLRRLACEPLIARPLRLREAGWRPAHEATRDGVFHWAQDEWGLARA